MPRVALFLIATLVPTTSLCQELSVDFRYAPAKYFAAICLPNDRLKSVVTESFGLGYDFGPGPYAVPLTEVRVRAHAESLVISGQRCTDPEVPLYAATLFGEGIRVEQEVLAVPLGKMGVGPRVTATVQRSQGWNGTIGWVRPEGRVDPAFRNVAWGVNRPILYRVPVTRGGRKLVAMGLCEPYKWGPGTRILDLRVEGSDPRIFDPLAAGKKNEPEVVFFNGRDEDGDGYLRIEAHAAVESPDPNPFLNVFWVFPAEARISSTDLITGARSNEAEVYFDCGAEEEKWKSDLRADLIRSVFKGKLVTPEISIRSGRALQFDSTSGLLRAGGSPFIVSRPAPVRAYQDGDGWHLLLPPGSRDVEVYALHGPWSDRLAGKLPTYKKATEAARRFWQRDIRLPHSRFSVPDSGIQYLLDASIRNLYQLGEIIDGGVEFHPGPSVYRGLWVHDAAWHISSLLYLGDAISAKLAIEHLLSFQNASGQIQVMTPYIMNRESPIVAFTMYRYAILADDRDWMIRNWEKFERALAWTEERRRETLVDPASPAYGLFPAGFADGGVGGMGYEYASVYWALIGFRTGIDAAVWLKRPESALRWQKAYDELMKSFRRAAARDLRRNEAGHWYLPTRVADTSGSTPPQLANWPILDAQGLAHLFDPSDSLVTGTLAMLEDDTREGLPVNTGWLKDGLWPFFGSLLGITQAYQRNYEAAHRLLYAVANHASPLGTWVEEQLPKAAGTRTSGDASNATASALFIKQLRRLLIMERGDTVELLAGIPETWVGAGKLVSVKQCPAAGGKVSLTLGVSSDGRSAELRLAPFGRQGAPGIVTIDTGALRRAGFFSADGTPLPSAFRVARGRPFTAMLRR